MVFLMQNEGKTDNKKAMITVPIGEFSVPSKNEMLNFNSCTSAVSCADFQKKKISGRSADLGADLVYMRIFN